MLCKDSKSAYIRKLTGLSLKKINTTVHLALRKWP
jgi:hypothetical protein